MNLNLTMATRIGLNAVCLLGVAVALALGHSIFIPVTIAVLLASILYPAAVWLNKNLRLPWFFACLTMILGLVFASAAIIAGITASVPRLLEKLPRSEDEWKQKITEAEQKLKDTLPFDIEKFMQPQPQAKDPDPPRKPAPSPLPAGTGRDTKSALPDPPKVPDPEPEKVEVKAPPAPVRRGPSAFAESVTEVFSKNNVSKVLLEIGSVGLQQISQLTLILFVVLFLMLEGDLLAKKVRNIFGTSNETQRQVTAALAEMAEAVRTYLVWRTIVNLGLAIVLGIVYRNVFFLDQWFLWALITAVASYVPYIGTIAAGVPPMLEALVSGQPGVAVLILLFYIVVVTCEGYLIVPWVMGRSMDLNATTVMLACLFWHLVWGVAGLFLAMPLMAAVKAILLHVDGWKEWGELLSSVERPPEPDPRLEAVAKVVTDSEATVVIPPADPKAAPGGES